MKKTPVKTLGLLALLVLAACGPYRADRNPNPLQETERVVMLDRNMTYYLNIVKHVADRLPNGNLKVRLAIENEENTDYWVDVQVIFRDKDGFEVESTNWEPFMFHRRKVTTYEKVSLNNQAADYRVLIRNINKK